MVDYDEIEKKLKRVIDLSFDPAGTEKLNELYRQVAPVLAGRPVELQFKKPHGSDGLAIGSKNQTIIQVDPYTQERETLYLFLHECAHVRHGHTGTYHPNKPPGKIDWQEIRKTIDNRVVDRDDEAIAEHQAGLWFIWAASRTDDVSVAGLLTALLNWKE